MKDESAPGADWKPTATEIDRAGDALLEALLGLSLTFEIATRSHVRPQVGDLVVVTAARALDWERVGYLLTVPSDDAFELWSVPGRVVRWSNAACSRIDIGPRRLSSLPYPTQPQIEESRRTGHPPKDYP